MKYQAMEELRHQYPVPTMCRLLGMSSSGYYAWRHRKPSLRSQQEPRLEAEIRAAHGRTRETCGPERLQRDLAEHGVQVGLHRIRRLRKKLGLRSKQKRKFKATTNSKHNLPVAPNLLEQRFAAEAPDQVWTGDLTYISTDEGWLYLAGLKDTDRGSQYCSHEYRALVAQFDMLASMSRRGNCYDNAPIESFWGTLKNELIYHRRYATREQARREIAEYIDMFYNRQRRQARLGYLSPAAFRQQYLQQKTAA